MPEFLRTHPVTSSRISDTRGRAETYPYKQYPDSLGYQLTKAKIRVLTTTDQADAYKYFQPRLTQGTLEQRTVARYGLGLVALNEQKYKEAESVFQSLTKQYPEQPQYAAALSRTALDSRNYPTAVDRYQKLAEQFPENESIKLEYISSLIKAGKTEPARNTLSSLNPETQLLPIYWELLAQVYSNLNEPAESHRYLAEYYYATGQTKAAILQIKLAQELKGVNYQLSSILSERLNFFLAQEQEERRNR
jgi:predicted Zn-dependent protease